MHSRPPVLPTWTTSFTHPSSIGVFLDYVRPTYPDSTVLPTQTLSDLPTQTLSDLPTQTLRGQGAATAVRGRRHIPSHCTSYRHVTSRSFVEPMTSYGSAAKRSGTGAEVGSGGGVEFSAGTRSSGGGRWRWGRASVAVRYCRCCQECPKAWLSIISRQFFFKNQNCKIDVGTAAADTHSAVPYYHRYHHC